MLLFGHTARNRVLLSLAAQGPLSGRELARLSNIDRAHVSAILSDFQNMGVVKREHGQRSKASFNDAFFAFPEMITLLNALNGQRVIVMRDPNPATPPPSSALLRLFGTPDRTRALIGLAAAQSANLHRLAGIAGVNPRAVTEVVRHFEGQGIVRSHFAGIERVVEFDPNFRFHDLLISLLRRLGDAFPTVVKAAQYYRERAELHGTELRASPDPNFRAGLMPLGEDVQAHVLFELARRGPLTTSGLAAVTGKSMNCARSAVLSLGAYGLVVHNTFGSGHTKKRWAALNPLHPLTKPLEEYARELFPDAVATLRLPPAGFPATRASAPIRQALPGHRLRIACALAVFAKPGMGTPDIARMLREPSQKPIKRWLEDLHAHELIDYGPLGARMVAAPNPRFRASSSLSNLIEAMKEFLTRPID